MAYFYNSTDIDVRKTASFKHSSPCPFTPSNYKVKLPALYTELSWSVKALKGTASVWVTVWQADSKN